MNYQDDDENMNNPGSPGENGPSNDDIPLWLQGLDDKEPDDTKPISLEEDSGSEDWIHTSDDSHADSEPEPELDSDFELNHEEGVSPDDTDQDVAEPDDDWDLDEALLSEQVAAEDKFEEGFSPDQDYEDMGVVFPSGEDSSEPDEASNDEFSSPEGFLDISELPSSATPEGDETFFENEPIRHGELPEWLQDMINEPDDLQPEFDAMDEPEVPDLMDTPTEISAEAMVLDIEPDAAEPSQDEALSNDKNTDEESELVDAISMVDEETNPVPISVTEEHEPVLIDDEEPKFSDMNMQEESEVVLTQIQQHLDQEEIDAALPLINSMIESIPDLEELEHLLTSTAKKDTSIRSQVFEALGDVALKQNRPEEALQAYAKAIKHLQVHDEAYDEAG
jgi:hypothetical protein